MTRAFDRLTRDDVAWLLLRGEFDPEEPQGDVDVLVGRGDSDRARQALVDSGFAPLFAPGRGRHRFFVRYLEPEDLWLKLDVVDEIAFGRYQELRTEAADGVLARRHELGVLGLPAPDDAFWLLLLHCLLDKGRVGQRHRATLATLAAQATTDNELARLAADAGLPDGPRQLLAAARAGDWDRLAELGADLRRSRRHRRRVDVRRRLVTNAVLRRAGVSLKPAARLPTVELRGPAGEAARCVQALRAGCPLPIRTTRSLLAARLRSKSGGRVGLVVTLRGTPTPAADVSLAVGGGVEPATVARGLSARIWSLLAPSEAGADA